jgi:phosphoacetylglucosamine mutase
MLKRGMKSLNEWNEMYIDMPSKQIKVAVKDRSAIVTMDAERKIAKPEGLQAQIDDLVARYPGSRTFVRPSGTEDVVRIYAEANTVHDVEELAHHVEELVVGNLS